MQSTHGRAAGELYGIQFSLEAVSEAEVYHLIALHSDHNLVGCAVLRDFLPAYILTGEEKYKHIPYEHKSAFKQCRKVKCVTRLHCSDYKRYTVKCFGSYLSGYAVPTKTSTNTFQMNT